VERLPARKARTGRLEQPLPRVLAAALRHAGADPLYSHQAQAINAIRAGQDVVLVTSTASGKTLAYNVPVLEAILADRRARALYLFPAKALAQDQLRSLRDLIGPAGQALGQPVRIGTYDGDTSRTIRRKLRRSAHVILTNPDMLHLGILPNHTLWVDFLTNLRFVVIDEAHVYRGVFGGHVGCVLRRLWRLCAHYGSHPQLVACSATIANPGEHLARLAAVDPVVVDDDGAPHGARDFWLWNPPFVDRTRTGRRSPNSEAAALLAQLVQRKIRTLAFSATRRGAELILLYARRILEREAPSLAGRIRAYRAGYRPEHRREIERGLFEGHLWGVVATTALELGIDVGDLDATLLVGYPGTVASLWQQAGRAGRGAAHALSILIGRDGPLDQYFMQHPKELFGRPHEHALIDPSNPHLLEQHLPCAAYELPLATQGSPHGLDDEHLFGPGFERAMLALEARRELVYRPAGQGRWYVWDDRYPAQDVSLRAIAAGRVALLNTAEGFRTLEEIEATTASFRAHPGAIYLHQGESFLVTELDLDAGHALLKPTEADYYTVPRELNDVRILHSLRHRQVGRASAHLGQVDVTQHVIGYRRVRQFGEKTLSVHELDLAPQRFETVALWWDVPEAICQGVGHRGLDVAGGLHALEHACIGLLPLFAMCDRWDLGGLSTPRHPDTGQALVFLYDAFPGGVGISEKGFELLPALWKATRDAVRDCPCRDGCPSCVQSPRCGNNNEPLDKRAAVMILDQLLRGG
jgi:DEAD/DEAH box helicase domain-containing protein